MPRGKRRLLGTEVEREIADLYRSGEPVPSIKATYEISDSVLYRVLKNQNVPTRRGGGTFAAAQNMAQAIADLPVSIARSLPTEIVSPSDIPNMPHTWPQRVTADVNGIVQSVEPIRSSIKTYTWEVRFESAMRVEAASIEAAISEVSRLPMCRRVFNVALKGAP